MGLGYLLIEFRPSLLKAVSQHAEMFIKSELRDNTLWQMLAVFGIDAHPQMNNSFKN